MLAARTEDLSWCMIGCRKAACGCSGEDALLGRTAGWLGVVSFLWRHIGIRLNSFLSRSAMDLEGAMMGWIRLSHWKSLRRRQISGKDCSIINKEGESRFITVFHRQACSQASSVRHRYHTGSHGVSSAPSTAASHRLQKNILRLGVPYWVVWRAQRQNGFPSQILSQRRLPRGQTGIGQV